MAGASGGGRVSGLNANHGRALYASALAIGRLLGEIEAVATSDESPFRRFADDLSPVQKQVLIALVRAAHARMVGALARFGVPAPSPSGSARSAARNALTFAEIALQEIEPSRLRGYGSLSPEAEAALEPMLADLAATFENVRDFLAESTEGDLVERIRRLDEGVKEREALLHVERAIRERGLVALRLSLRALVEQVESGTYEIAIFGRVSSGKSSLLNAVMERQVLPVGITPVTSVPTRLVWGASPAMIVRHQNASEDQRHPIGELEAFVTEALNPGNCKAVARITVELPVDRLRGGIALVDTPGLGALASSGAREAYAYMPRCDLGVIIVDGGSTIEAPDIDIARTLLDSGIEIEVLLSKADRIVDDDRAALAKYVQAQLLERLGTEVRVRWVSSVGADGQLARAWFDDALAPRIVHARELSAESIRRKLASLQAFVERAAPRSDEGAEGEQSTAERIGGEAARYVDGRRRKSEEAIGHSRDLTLDVVRAAAATLVHSHEAPAEEVVRATLLSCVDRERDRLRVALLETRDRLHDLIREAATATGINVDPKVVSVDLTDMPTVDPLDFGNLRVERPRFAPYRERRIAEKLAEQAGDIIESTLRRFETRLRAWARSSFARLGAQFASQIEPLRASAPSGT